MSQLFTLDDLQRILREAAGEDVDLAGGADADFAELGYESIALLETSSRISREFGVVIDDDAVTTESTPRALVQLVNDQLTRAPRPV
jgi:minimal PKS acyl carrier protein